MRNTGRRSAAGRSLMRRTTSVLPSTPRKGSAAIRQPRTDASVTLTAKVRGSVGQSMAELGRISVHNKASAWTTQHAPAIVAAEVRRTPATEGNPAVGWIAAIVIGAIAGWLAEQFMKSNMGLLMNIILGIVGAAIASALLGFFGISLGGWIGYLIAGFIGACILIAVARMIRR